MRAKINVGEALKVAALCLPPVILALIGLAAMGREPTEADHCRPRRGHPGRRR